MGLKVSFNNWFRQRNPKPYQVRYWSLLGSLQVLNTIQQDCKQRTDNLKWRCDRLWGEQSFVTQGYFVNFNHDSLPVVMKTRWIASKVTRVTTCTKVWLVRPGVVIGRLTAVLMYHGSFAYSGIYDKWFLVGIENGRLLWKYWKAWSRQKRR